MSSLVIIIHIVVAVALILIVLLQTGKGADMGAAFGGGASQTLFGGGGASTFLSKLTTIAAIIFMLTSLGLAYLSGHRTSRSVTSQIVIPTTEPTEQAPLEVPVQPADKGVDVDVEKSPVQATAKEADVAKTPVQPAAKKADTAKAAPQQAGVDEAAKKTE